jgi:hypothetical protein
MRLPGLTQINVPRPCIGKGFLRNPYGLHPLKELTMSSNSMQQTMTMSSLPFFAVNQKLLQAMAHLNADALQGAVRYQIETLTFLKRRCEADVKLMDDLAGSREFNDAFDVMSNFVQNTASEYTAEVSRIATISSKLASETAKYARAEARHAIEDAAAATVA